MDEMAKGPSIRVCTINDLTEGTSIVKEIRGTQIAVIMLNGNVYALENVCPHQGGPLGEGKIEDDCVYCPWHGWQFNVKTGEHIQGTESVRTYSVTVKDSDVYVNL